MRKKNKSPMVLCIMDGWGLSNETKYNAVYLAKTPNFDKLQKTYPSCKLEASGESVGLPSNQIGNSEVGHMNIGSGRVILQSLPRIDKAFTDNKVSQIDKFKSFFKKHNDHKSVHIIGLYSNGGVHSHANHIINICKLASKKCNYIKLHLFSDGRDTLPNEFGSIIDELTTNIPSTVEISTLIGRYYSMDRDNRWDRIEKAYNLLPETPKVTIITGGGQKNKFLVSLLKDHIFGEILTSQEMNLPGDYIEAELIAFLAARNYFGLPSTFPSTTGATKDIICGEYIKYN